MSDTFERALKVAGLDVRVELRDGLAILVPRSGHGLATDSQRRTAVALAAGHGISHVALELVE